MIKGSYLFYRIDKSSASGFSYDDGSRAELSGLMETGAEYERPTFGGDYTPVVSGTNHTYPTPAYTAPSYPPNSDNLTPYGGGYASSMGRYTPPNGPPPSSQYAPEPRYDASRESFDLNEMSPRNVKSSIP